MSLRTTLESCEKESDENDEGSFPAVNIVFRSLIVPEANSSIDEASITPVVESFKKFRPVTDTSVVSIVIIVSDPIPIISLVPASYTATTPAIVPVILVTAEASTATVVV